MFGSLDPAKIVVILVIALVVLGPERLPRAARQLGAAWRELTRLRVQVTEEVRSAMPDLGLDDLDLPHLPKRPAAAVSGFVRDLTASPAASVTAEAAEEPGRGGPEQVPLSSIEHSASSGPSLPAARAPRSLRRGEPAPEGGSLVVLAPERGELAVVFDDPAMN